MSATRPNATRDLSAAAEALYTRVISESCVYVTDIASQLPSFTEHTFAEVLRREDKLIKNTEKALEALQHISEQLDPMISADRFEIDYRRAVVSNLDELNLIGVDVSPANRRHRLSVAYITLSVEVKRRALRKNDVISVDEALSTTSRMLIRGEPGSGKTTLLRWIAVGAAGKSFEGALADWNNLIPFYIRLRECVHNGLPRPESFPGFSTPAIADTMPKGWVHQILEAGRALVLVDGLDEIPASQRENVRTWLGDLIKSYKKARYIITSRPHAAEEGWMSEIVYADAELQSMGLTDMDMFIEHWHKAVREELRVEQERAELESLAQHLKDRVKNTRPIRMLAKNPLLCAMLCALNRERRRQLPINRIELYKACCSLLLDRRDKDRQVDLSDYLPLSYSQKLRLLEDLAYDMVRSGLSEREISKVDKGFARKLANMPGLAPDTDVERVRKFFVERTGMIRELVVGQIDFTHRTFQEFFAAQAAVDLQDIQTLLDHAHDDQWRELIILAVGLANQSLCEQLIAGLIQRGDQETDYRYQLHLLAVASLETAIELKPALRAEVEKRLSKLVPPKSISDAKSLAAAGELAIQHLAWENFPAQTVAACVYTLALISGDAALSMLTTYANDTRVEVRHELIKAWESFDGEEYAKQVLSQTLRDTKELSLKRKSSLDGFQYLSQLITLNLTECRKISDLRPLASLTQLTTLNLAECSGISDLTPLASLTQLTTLDITRCGYIRDLTPLASLTRLTKLYLAGCSGISDLTPLTRLPKLDILQLGAGFNHGIPESIKSRATIY